MRVTTLVLAVAVSLLVAVDAARAASITAGGSVIGVTAVPAPGNDGYEFFSVDTDGNNITHLPGYAAVAINASGNYTDNTYSALTISGNAHTTGVIYGPTAGQLLATITLGAGVPGNLQLGFLEDNSNTRFNNTALTLTLSSAPGSPITINSPVNTNHDSNDFFLANVVGASPGDTITVFGVGNSNAATLGGITFDHTVPEPSSIILCGLGAIGLLVVGRRRKV